MAKQPTGYNSDFLGNGPSRSIFDPSYLNKYLSQAVLGSKEGFNSFFTDELTRPKIEEARRKKIQLENDNFQINSLRALTRNAYSDIQTADKVAGDFFNRLNSASNKDELNSIYGEIEDVQKRATTNTQLFGLTKGLGDVTAESPTAQNILQATKKVGNILGSIVETAGDIADYGVEAYLGVTGNKTLLKGSVQSPKLEKEKLLKSNKLSDEDFQYVSRTFNPTELFGNVKGFIDKKQSGFNAVTKVQNPEIFSSIQKAVSSPSKQNAFDDIIKQKFLEATTTRGNNFYSGSLEKEEQQKFISKGLAALANPGSDLDNKYFKYDLENEALAELQSGTMQLLQKERSKPLEEQNKGTVKELTATLNSLEARRKESDKIYGVNKFSPWYEGSDRSGFWHSFGSTMTSWANLARDDFSGAARNNAAYKPEVIKYDKNGNPIMSNQFAYEKADGSTGYNWGSALDIGGQVIGQILPTLATTSLVSGVGKGLAQYSWAANSAKAGIGLKTLGNIGRAAEVLGANYDKLNKFKGLKIADRVATFATVSLTTMPSIIEQEKKWGGDYQYRGIVKAMIEGLTEGLGFPDVGALRSVPFKSTIVSDLKRLLAADLSVSERFLAYTHSAQAFGGMALKQNTVEALEEELSLLGNSLFEDSLNEDLEGRPKEEFNSENIQRTFVDSFVGGILYSGFSTGMQAKATLKPSNLRNLTNWDVANNPELYKAHLFDMTKKGKLDDKQLAQGMQKITELQGMLDGMTSMSRIKDMKTLLDDKDEQFKYFTNTVKLSNLLKIDGNDLTDEDRTILAKYQTENKVNEKLINSVRESVAKLDQIAPEELTEEQIKEKPQLTDQYGFLKKLNFRILNGEDIAKEDIEYLTSRGLIPDTSIDFTKEDVDREIKNVRQELVNTKKRIDKYDNLTDQQKTDIINKSYDDKIEEIKKVKSLDQLRASEKAVKDDLDYLKLKDKDYNKEDIANRERLYEAYADRAAEMGTRGEDGYNEVEREFEQEGIYDNSINQNDLFALAELAELARENKDIIEPDLYNSITENINNANKQVIENLTNVSEQNLPQAKADALYTFLLKAAPKHSGYLYNLDAVNEFFSWNGVGVEYTALDLVDARERVIETRAAINSKRVASKQSPYEQREEDVIAEAEEAGLTEKEITDIKELSTETKAVVEVLNTSSKEVDESGTSPYKEILKQDYENKKAKFKTFAELSKIAYFLKNLIFAKSTSFTSNYQKLATIHTNVFATGDLVTFNAAIDQLMKENPNNTELDSYKDFVNRLLTDFPITATSTEEGTIGGAVETPLQNNITPSILTGDIKQIEDELTNQDRQKQERLISLASPMRTMAVEVAKDDVARTDAAVLRKVSQIEELKTQNDPSKSVVIINRKEFMTKFFREIKGMSEEQATEALNAFEDFFRNNEKGTPMPEELVNLVGDKFFEASMVDYFLENNSKGFSTEPDVLISTVDKSGKLVLVQDYPIDLSVTSSKNKEGNIPWNVSNRVLPGLQSLGYTREQAEQLILAEHQATFEQFEEIKKAVKAGSQVIAPFSVSNGVMINKPKQLSREELKQEGISDVETKTLEDFKLITGSGDEAFGKTLQFEIGRLYLNVDGQPVLLSNKQIYPDEAAALTELLFLSVEPDEFDSPAQFRNYMFSLINQADRKNRLYFKENPDYGKVEGAPHTVVIQSITDDKGVRTYKQLSKEEVGAILPQMYYKVNKASLDGKRSILRYYIDSEGENAGQINSANQPYLDYLKDTHTFPVANGALSKPVNKQIYFTPEIKPKTPPLTTTEKKTTEAPVQAKSTDTTVVPPSPFKDDATTTAVAKVKTLMPDADKISSILTYEEAVEEHKKASKFLPVSASVFTSKELYEAIIDEIIFRNLPIKAVGFIEDITYDLKSANSAKEATTGLSIMLVSNPENPAQTFRIYLSLDTTKGEHIMGVKAAELNNPETVIVPKEEPKAKPEGSFDTEEWLNNTFGEENAPTVTESENIPTPVPTVQETPVDIAAKKASIESEKKKDLQQHKDIPENSYIMPQSSPKQALIKFREYLTDVLGWEKMPISYNNNALVLDYLGTELRIPAKVVQLGGGNSAINLNNVSGVTNIFLEIDVKDVIEAKYNAELAALETPQETKSPATQSAPVVEKQMTARERLNSMERTTDQAIDEKTKEESKEAKDNCKFSDLQDNINKRGNVKPKDRITPKKK